MRRFFSLSFLTLALMIGATGATPVAHAATEGSICDYTDAGTQDGTIQNGKCVSNGTYGYQNTSGTTAENVAANAAALKAANQTPTVNPGSSDTAFNPVMSAIAGLFAWLVGVAALTLDYSVYYTVVNMGAYIHKLTAIGVTWRILRDIGNIMLIFGFLAIGISIILNTERLGWGKKMIPMLLVAAVFLNFSLFFSEAIIDTGNLFATQFYTQINGGVTPTADTLKGITNANTGISSKLMSQLGLQSIYDVQKNSALLKGNTPWYIGFLAILLFIVTAFVMFSLAFILIARFIWLVFLIILAPIGFAGLAVPQLKHKAGQWWSSLFEQTITAPVLLLLLYVALAVITDAQFLTGLGGGTAGAITGFVDNNNLAAFASYMMSFSIAIGLMLAVTISAKSLSAFGADKATALASKLSGVSIAAGMPGWVGRNTIGAGGNYAAKKLRNTAFGRSFVGRGIAGTLEKNVAGASFDIRNTSVGKSAAGVGLSLGKGQTGGYKADLEARVKSYEKAGAAITGRAQTKEEKETLVAAEKKKTEAESGHATIKTEHDIATQEIKTQKEEIARLEEEKKKDKYFEASGRQKELDAAHQNLTDRESTLAPVAEKLAQAEKDKAAAIAEHTAKKSEIEAATSAESAKKAYATRLEKGWGKIPFFGTAATQAAKNIVKTKAQKDLENIQKLIAESEKPKEDKEKEKKPDEKKPEAAH